MMLVIVVFVILFVISVFVVDLLGKGIMVKFVQSIIFEESFQILLVSCVLEKLGYIVEKFSEVDYNVVYMLIVVGDIIFIVINW